MDGIITVFVCEDSLDGIFTGVYDAWDSRLGHKNVRLEICQEEELELFCQYRPVETDREKAEKVFRTIERRMGEGAITHICQAAASADGRKADAIYRMVVLGLSLERGSEVVNCLTYGPVSTVMDLSQKAWHEAHKLMGFLRFSELQSGVLYGPVRPVHQVLSFLAPYFADRLRHENWLIHDVGREEMAVHRADTGWILVRDEALDAERLKWVSEKEARFQELWKCFHKTIAVEERINRSLQRQMLSLRFRSFMPEFADDGGRRT